MFENPLLPNRRLLEMLDLMQRTRALDRHAKAKLPAREALLAATAIHLVPGDLLVPQPSDTVAPTVAPAPIPNALAENAVVVPDKDVPLPKVSRLALAAAMAHGLQVSGTGGIVLTFTSAGALEPGWQEALTYAQRALLPVLLAVSGSTNARSPKSPAAFNLTTMQAFAKKLKLPVLTVDGDDAVAVYRVMQECTLRARLSEGPAIIWGVHDPAAKPSASPIARLERYLKVRNLLPRKTR